MAGMHLPLVLQKVVEIEDFPDRDLVGDSSFGLAVVVVLPVAMGKRLVVWVHPARWDSFARCCLSHHYHHQHLVDELVDSAFVVPVAHRDVVDPLSDFHDCQHYAAVAVLVWLDFRPCWAALACQDAVRAELPWDVAVAFLREKAVWAVRQVDEAVWN